MDERIKMDDRINGQEIGAVESGSPSIICWEACYKNVRGKKEHCCKSFGCGTFFGCGGCFSAGNPGKPYKACQTYTSIARSVVQLLIVAFGLLSIMEFGNMMDNSHFPGAGIQLDRYDKGNNTDLIWDSFKDGYFLEVVGEGKNDENASECSNFITPSDLPTTYKQLCQGTTNKTQEWKTGWVSAYKCDRSGENLLGMNNECSGWSGNISMFGMLSFYMLAAYVFLFALATWIEQNDGNLYITKYSIGDRCSCARHFRPDGKGKMTKDRVKGWCCRNTGERNVVWITLFWSIGGIILAILAAGSWVSMCDKIDTGLGRKMKIVDPESEDIVIPNGHACASIGCEATFGSLFLWYALTVAFILLPNVFMFYFPAIVPASTKTSGDIEMSKPDPVGAAVVDPDVVSLAYSRRYTGHLKM